MLGIHDKGHTAQAEEAKKWLSESTGLRLKSLPSISGEGTVQTSATSNAFGVCAKAAGRRQEAE